MRNRVFKICVIGPLHSPHVKTRVQAFVARGHEMHAIMRRKTEERISGVEYHMLGDPNDASVFDMELFESYLDTVERIKPDFVHVHFAQDPWAWAMAASGYHPLVVSVMGADVLFEEQGNPSRTTRSLTTGVFRQADIITAKSQYLCDALGRLGGFDSKAFRTLWRPDLENFKASDPAKFRERLGLQEQGPIIISPKALQPFYNIHILVEALSIVRPRYPMARLILSEFRADDAYRTHLQERIRTLGLESAVRFAGSIDYADMPDFLTLGDVVVSIPPSDGLPMTLLEAWASGVPNIVSDSANLRELVTNEENALAVEATAESVARAMLRIFDDPGLRRRIVRGGFDTIEDLPTMEDDVVEIENRIAQFQAKPIWTSTLRSRLWLLQTYFIWRLEQFPQLRAFADAKSIAGLSEKIDFLLPVKAMLIARQLEEGVSEFSEIKTYVRLFVKEIFYSIVNVVREGFFLPGSAQKLAPEVWSFEHKIREVLEGDILQSHRRPNEKSRRALILSHMYPDPQNAVQGIFVQEQVKALSEFGVESVVLSGRPHWVSVRNPVRFLVDFHRYFRASPVVDVRNGVPVIYVPYMVGAFVPISLQSFSYRLAMGHVLKLARVGLRFDVVHAHTAFLDGATARWVKRRFRLPVVLTEHTGPFSTLMRSWLMARETRAALSGADAVIAVSKSLRMAILEQTGLPLEDGIAVLGNGFDPEVFRPGDVERPPGQRIEALWVGHHVDVKRVDRLLRAFARARVEEPGLRLTLVGEGPLKESHETLARQLGLANDTIFKPYLDRESVAAHMRNSDFLVISSESETFGMVAIEAMGTGIPVVSTACGGPEETIAIPAVGEIVENHEDGLAAGMLSMARRRENFDRAKIRAFAVDNYSYRKIIERLIGIYEDVLSQNPERQTQRGKADATLTGDLS